MKFRTEIEIEKSIHKIEHKHKILTIGSCFADNIGQKFSSLKFQISQNPFGVLFNPQSILNSIEISFENRLFNENDLFFFQGEFHSFFHHSSFSSHKLDEILDKINFTTKQANKFLNEVDWVILTFGTSFIYTHLEKGIVVSNNHKLPENQFDRKKLTNFETTQIILKTIKLIKYQNPKAKIIVTVSPVRHWKDGAIENQRSKANLILALEKIENEFNDVVYFPSYELLLDDLRDYRFYGSDLIHPSEEAINYIWEKFSATFFDEKTLEIISRIEKIVQAKNHKIRNPESEEGKNFLTNLNKQISEIENGFEYIKF